MHANKVLLHNIPDFHVVRQRVDRVYLLLHANGNSHSSFLRGTKALLVTHWHLIWVWIIFFSWTFFSFVLVRFSCVQMLFDCLTWPENFSFWTFISVAFSRMAYFPACLNQTLMRYSCSGVFSSPTSEVKSLTVKIRHFFTLRTLCVDFCVCFPNRKRSTSLRMLAAVTKNQQLNVNPVALHDVICFGRRSLTSAVANILASIRVSIDYNSTDSTRTEAPRCNYKIEENRLNWDIYSAFRGGFVYSA